MTKVELRKVAKAYLVDGLAKVNYAVFEDDSGTCADLSEEEKRYVSSMVDKYGTSMCKAIGEEYFTY